MSWNFRTLADLFREAGNAQFLTEGYWGLEKEAQRVTASGDLALIPHPSVFGDKLKNHAAKLRKLLDRHILRKESEFYSSVRSRSRARARRW